MSPSVRHRILVCDDEPAARRGLVRALGGAFDYVECGSGVECLEVLAGEPADLVLLDLRMPGLDGRTTLARILELPQPPPVVMVTADSSLRTAIDAVKAGAADFLAKPYEIEELRWVVSRTLERTHLRRENRALAAEVRRLGGSGDLLGESPAMRQLFGEIEAVAPTTASVLIRGATGTGKELVARRIHQLSGVAGGPFVALNCAAVPESLLESELFGHRKGAFTGADRDRVGRFREAHGGTLFLDEIGDMPLAAQAKLLRVLQERLVEPLGGGQAVRVDVRVIAATHRDLLALAHEQQFREDLYYRLRVVELEVPPLTQRQGDVVLLARHFLAPPGRPTSGPLGVELAPEASAALQAHTWPGNVRELRNAMERAAIFCRGAVQLEDLPAEIRGGSGASRPAAEAVHLTATDQQIDFQDAKTAAIDAFERDFFTAALRRHRGNVSRAAREAGMHRQNLQKKLRRLGLDPASFRGLGD
ncbi:MAG: sigma-54 dependent transcriptional regulator [Acidobacteriota bacterium]